LLLSGVLAGCGAGASSPGVAHIPTESTSTGPSAPQAGDAGIGALPGAGGTSESSKDSPDEVSLAGTLKLSRCMRANGVADFPDPNSQSAVEFSTREINPNSAQFDRALRRCEKYMRGGQGPSPAQRAQARERTVRFANCMRSHGVPNFPDPPSGSGSSQLAGPGPAPPGLDPHSPIFARAAKQCGSLLLPRGAGSPPTARS
jgi:hypothetical protein